jgi:hypothetical protein
MCVCACVCACVRACLLDFCAVASLGCNSLVFVDARPKANAMGNQVSVGGGFETPQDYISAPGAAAHGIQYCSLVFAGIENIHAVSASHQQIIDMVKELTAYSQLPSYMCPLWPGIVDRIARTGWMQHVSTILFHASRITTLLNKSVSVLVHCTIYDRVCDFITIIYFIYIYIFYPGAPPARA